MTDDLADDIRAAMSAQDGGNSEPPVIEAPEAPKVEDPTTEVEKPDEGRVRGADGKFVAKADKVEQDNTDQTKVAETPESIRPPASWSAAAKAKFATLDPDVQREVLKREKDVESGFRERADKLKQYEPLESVIAPYRQKWQVAGVDEATAVKQLLAASDWLERDPAGAIEYLARQYGVAGSAQPTQGQPQQAQPAGNSQTPEYQALQRELAEIKSQMASREAENYQSQIAAFAADPANLYFENVRGDMAQLITSGQAKDLAEAYEMACWMRPDIRPLLQTPQVTTDTNQRDRVAQAKAAGASVTGAPSSGGVTVQSDGTIEGDIRLAIQQAASRA